MIALKENWKNRTEPRRRKDTKDHEYSITSQRGTIRSHPYGMFGPSRLKTAILWAVEQHVTSGMKT